MIIDAKMAAQPILASLGVTVSVATLVVVSAGVDIRVAIRFFFPLF